METNQQNQDEIEIDLLELLRVLCSKIGYVILAALALGLLMVLVSKCIDEAASMNRQRKCMYCPNRTVAIP